MTKTLTIREQALEIQWICAGDGPVLVFLHEGLGSLGLWKDFPLLLARACKCPAFVFSRAGYGRSDPCPLPRKINFMHQEALGVLPKLLEKAGMRDHILIGHSDGGSIGIIYAGSPFASRLQGLITMAAHVFCEPLTIASIQEARKAYVKGNLKKRLSPHHGANTDTAFWGWNRAWLAPRFIHFNIEKYLHKIQVPVLALQGRQDPYGTLAQLAAISQKARNSRIEIIEDCGHAPHLEQKETVLGLMAGFIRGLGNT